MNGNGSVALRVERHDGAYGFEDLIPGDTSIETFTRIAAPKVRYALVDVSSGKPITYSLLDEDAREVPKESTVGRAFPQGRAKVTICREFRNAR